MPEPTASAVPAARLIALLHADDGQQNINCRFCLARSRSSLKPPHWMPPSILAVPMVVTAAEIAEAEAELATLEWHAVKVPAFLDAELQWRA